MWAEWTKSKTGKSGEVFFAAGCFSLRFGCTLVPASSLWGQKSAQNHAGCVSFTCRVVERQAVVQHVVWPHPEAVVNQGGHAVVPEHTGRRSQRETKEKMTSLKKKNRSNLFLCVCLVVFELHMKVSTSTKTALPVCVCVCVCLPTCCAQQWQLWASPWFPTCRCRTDDLQQRRHVHMWDAALVHTSLREKRLVLVAEDFSPTAHSHFQSVSGYRKENVCKNKITTI